MMGEIYSGASQVIIWLGEDEGDLDAIVWLQDIFDPYIGCQDGSSMKIFDQPIDSLLKHLEITKSDRHKTWAFADRFFNVGDGSVARG